MNMENITSFFWSLTQILRIFLANMVPGNVGAVNWSQREWTHPMKSLDSVEMRTLVHTTPEMHQYFNETLKKILVVRVPGTDSHRRVKEFINETMTDLGWTVEEDAFTANTPHGSKPFTNIIATLNPRACKRLVIACHYDSKYFPGNRFVGATDSAVPCTMMIELARALKAPLNLHSQINVQLTPQFVFFDGEEAFESWTDDDSLYGSRHLANKWNQKRFPHTLEDRERCPGDYVSELDRIDVLVLLDLLGAANPHFYSFFYDTNPLYSKLVKAEQKLNSLNLLKAEPPRSTTSYFKNRLSIASVDDDHKPFRKRNVPVIHVIPSPFPAVWHKIADNYQALSHDTINNLMNIFKCWISEYFSLDTSMMNSDEF